MAHQQANSYAQSEQCEENTQAVSIEQSQKLCTLCDTLSVEDLKHAEFRHYSSLEKLVHSATVQCCTLCALIWQSIKTQNTEDLVSRKRKDESNSAMAINGNLSAFQTGYLWNELWVSCGSELSGEACHCTLRLFSRRVDPPLTLIVGREVTSNPCTLENWSDIDIWIKNCTQSQKHSQHCRKPTDTVLPTRVINVGMEDSQEPFLQVTNGEYGKYIALSYAWGSSHEFVTTSESLAQRLHEIPLSNMPKTFRDAVVVTRRLGIQFLWVDALCIIQKSYENDMAARADWQDQSKRMASVYNNAWLTISAGNARDKQEGFLVPRPQHAICSIRYFSPSTIIPLPHFTRAYVRPKISQDEGFLRSRAWTFQEAILSPRAIVYGKDQMFFRCRTHAIYESGNIYNIGGSINGGWANPTAFFTLSDQHISEREQALNHWYFSVSHDYTSRNILFETDKLPALSGLAHQAQEIIGGSYYAGLWEVDFVPGLLWKNPRVSTGGNRLLGKILQPTESYVAPSWSWASVRGQIVYSLSSPRRKGTFYPDSKYAAKNIVIFMEPDGPSFDPMGKIVSGYMTLTAPIKAATLVRRAKVEFVLRPRVWVLNSLEYLTAGKGEQEAQAEDVIAHCIFDIDSRSSVDPFCLLLTNEEGIMLKSDQVHPGCYTRIGYFLLESGQEAWFRNSEQRVTVY